MIEFICLIEYENPKYLEKRIIFAENKLKARIESCKIIKNYKEKIKELESKNVYISIEMKSIAVI